MPDATPAIIVMIEEGAADNGLDLIVNALQQRRRALALRRASEVEVGNRVRLVSISPKYFVGCEGVVEKLDGKFFSVTLDRMPPRAVRYSNPLMVPIGSVEVIG